MDLGLAGLLIAVIALIIAFPSLSRRIRRNVLPNALKVDFTPQLPLACTEDEGILLDYAEHKPLRYYTSRSLIVNKINSVFITLENESELGTIQVANFFVIKIFKCIKLPDRVAEFSKPKDGIGGGGNPKYYEGVVLASASESFAVSASDSQNLYNFLENNGENIGKPAYSHLTLQPNEVEEIILSVNFETGYYYEYAIGIPYKANGNDYYFWSEEIFRTVAAEDVLLLKPAGIIRENPEYEFGEIPSNYLDNPPIPYDEQFRHADYAESIPPSRLDRAKRLIEKGVSPRFPLPKEYPLYRDIYNVVTERFKIE